MHCVICLKNLGDMVVRVDEPKCQHHQSHLKCFRLWQPYDENEWEGNKCPECPTIGFRPLNWTVVHSKDAFYCDSDDEEDRRERVEEDGEEEEDDTREQEEVAIEAAVNLAAVEKAQIHNNVDGQAVVEDVEEFPILEGQVLYVPARQELPEKLAKMCPICFQVFATTVLKHKHIDAQHEPKNICQFCKSEFTRKDNFKKHVKKFHVRIDGQADN